MNDLISEMMLFHSAISGGSNALPYSFAVLTNSSTSSPIILKSFRFRSQIRDREEKRREEKIDKRRGDREDKRRSRRSRR